MEIILLDTMLELPSLEGVEEVVISKQVIDGTAPPLYIYADRADCRGNAIVRNQPATVQQYAIGAPVMIPVVALRSAHVVAASVGSTRSAPFLGY
jgi:hypothetical protein